MPSSVLALRRYPVKSMGGEGLDSLTLDARGITGDRWYAVRDEESRLASGKNSRRFRRRDRVFDYAARTLDGQVLVGDGSSEWAVGDPALDAQLSQVMGDRVRVAAESEIPHHDDGPVSLIGSATLEWCARRWGIDADPRRLRVNIVVATHEAFVEETWRDVQIGGAVGGARLSVMGRLPRCRMIDIDQDGAVATGGWLKPLGEERGASLAVHAEVFTRGSIRVGDQVVVE